MDARWSTKKEWAGDGERSPAGPEAQNGPQHGEAEVFQYQTTRYLVHQKYISNSAVNDTLGSFLKTAPACGLFHLPLSNCTRAPTDSILLLRRERWHVRFEMGFARCSDSAPCSSTTSSGIIGTVDELGTAENCTHQAESFLRGCCTVRILPESTASL